MNTTSSSNLSESGPTLDDSSEQSTTITAPQNSKSSQKAYEEFYKPQMEKMSSFKEPNTVWRIGALQANRMLNTFDTKTGRLFFVLGSLTMGACISTLANSPLLPTILATAFSVDRIIAFGQDISWLAAYEKAELKHWPKLISMSARSLSSSLMAVSGAFVWAGLRPFQKIDSAKNLSQRVTDFIDHKIEVGAQIHLEKTIFMGPRQCYEEAFTLLKKLEKEEASRNPNDSFQRLELLWRQGGFPVNSIGPLKFLKTEIKQLKKGENCEIYDFGSRCSYEISRRSQDDTGVIYLNLDTSIGFIQAINAAKEALILEAHLSPRQGSVGDLERHQAKNTPGIPPSKTRRL